MTTKSYSELIKIPDFYDRIKYLMTYNGVGDPTFGGRRELNQILYRDLEWKRARNRAIFRDCAGDFIMDLAHPDYPIDGPAYVHHINPITIDDVLKQRPCIYDLENLVCTSHMTHQSIHYGKIIIRSKEVIDRKPNDTCPWK